MAALSPANKARLLASGQAEAGAWLQALPSPQLGTLMSGESFRVSCALRMGCTVCEPHKCGPCGAEADSLGHHGLSCKRSAGRHSRHSAANDLIARALGTVDVATLLEPAGCARDNGKRPDGMTLIPWKRGKPLIWDFTCRDTFAPTYLPKTSRAAGAAAVVGEGNKRRDYAFLEARSIFVPVAIETSGYWGKEGLHLIREFGTRIMAKTGEKRATSFLIQRISLAVQRGNVASILGTLPPGREIEEIFLM